MNIQDLHNQATRLVADYPDLGESEIAELLRQAQPLAPTASVGVASHKAKQRQNGVGMLEPILADPSVTEVMINGAGQVWVDANGSVTPSGISLDAREITVLIERMLDPLGLRVDRSVPFADGRLADGSRINVVIPPLAPDGPLVTIRRFSKAPLPLTAFGPQSLVDVLVELVDTRATILVVGGTSTGKTSLLSSLVAHVSFTERLVAVEDTAEIQWGGQHVVRLEARPPNSEGVGEVTLRTLIRNALRMRPDRLVVGEVRGSEALDLILALNTGHRGSLATCHANGPVEAIMRLETLAAMGAGDTPSHVFRQQLLSGVDSIVHVERCGSQRKVVRVVAVVATSNKGWGTDQNIGYELQDRWVA